MGKMKGTRVTASLGAGVRLHGCVRRAGIQARSGHSEWLPQKREQEVTEHSNGGLAGSHESRSHRQNDNKIQGIREKSTHKVALVKTRRFQPSVDAGGTEEE